MQSFPRLEVEINFFFFPNCVPCNAWCFLGPRWGWRGETGGDGGRDLQLGLPPVRLSRTVLRDLPMGRLSWISIGKNTGETGSKLQSCWALVGQVKKKTICL